MFQTSHSFDNVPRASVCVSIYQYWVLDLWFNNKIAWPVKQR